MSTNILLILLTTISKFIVKWKSLATEKSHGYEMNLIQKFVAKYGKQPFANLTD